MKSMCSPGGSATLNSLMKLDTLLLEMTVHSHSLTLRIASETLTLRSPCTFVWHPSRQWSLISFRVKCPFSVSRISPPPSSTCRRHCPQLPLPPQAEERCTPFSLRVESSEPPCSTSSFLSPLMVMVTFPLGLRYFLAISSTTTSTRMVMRNTAMLTPINCPMLLLFCFCFLLYGLHSTVSVLFFLLLLCSGSECLELQSAEAHHRHGHESDGDEGDPHALQGLRHIAVFHLLTDGTKHDDGERPAQSAA